PTISGDTGMKKSLLLLVYTIGLFLTISLLSGVVAGYPTPCGNFPNVSFPIPTGGIDDLNYDPSGTPLPSGNPMDTAYLVGTFSGLPSGYDVENNVAYPEWCIDLN